MENAVDALKIGFAVLVFTMALSLAIYMFSQARETADVVLHSSDISEFMEYESFDNYLEAEGSINRIVGLETIIPTLYKYYKENYTIVFRNSSGYMKIYETKTNPNAWSDINKYYGKQSKTICSFDVDEETKRREPWTGSQENYKKNLDAFLSGGSFTSPSGNGIKYSYDSFIEKYKNSKFVESIGKYTYDAGNGEIYEQDYNYGLVKEKEKRVIIYTLQN